MMNSSAIQTPQRLAGIANETAATLDDGTSESEFSGFHNYTAAEVFVQGLAGLVNQSDVETMIRAQKQMLQRFEKTNAMLSNCNALSQSRLKVANDDFKKHVKLLAEMKKDLDYIFRKIRVIKQKLGQQYPVAYAEAQPQRSSLAEEAEDESEMAGCSKESEKTHNLKLENSIAKEEPIKDTVLHVEEEKQEKDPKKMTPTTAAATTTTIEYVQMEEAIENGKPIENELIKRVCSIETTNPNDSSDCTSEDTG